MNRYPDEIIILEAISGDLYTKATWQQIYRGRCRCFLDRQAAFRINKIMDCSYQVVIPDRYMPDIGENFKVGIKMHTSKSNHNWDLVGHVKDFARYDRVCNLYFQMVKENLIYEDLPPEGYDLTERKIVTYDDDYVHIESEGMIINGEQLVSNKPVMAWFKDNSKKVLITSNMVPDEVIYQREADAESGETLDTEMCIFAGHYQDPESNDDKVIFIPYYHKEEVEDVEGEVVEEEDDGLEFKPAVTFHVIEMVWNEDTGTYDEEEIFNKEYVIIE